MLGALLGMFQTSRRSAGRTDFVSAGGSALVNGPAGLITASLDSFSDFAGGVCQSGRLTAENRRLRAIADAERLYNVRLGELQGHIDSLEKLLKLDVPGRKRIPARVIGVFPDENRITVSAGSAEGVAVGVPVVAAEGLLGTVQTVDARTCQATLVWSPLPFKIGAIVAGRPGAAGLLHGEAPDSLVLDLSLNAPVQVGDLVTTSGFSARIPRGIPIGRVVRVQQDQDFGTERAWIYPSAELGDVQEVEVLQ